MARRGCKYSADSFCYVCGEFFAKKAKKHCLESCRRAKEAYHAYFRMPVGDQDKHWAPHVICEYCRRTLEGWFRGEKRAMRFAIPRVWREPTNHLTDCYFCMVDPSKRRKGKNAPSINYPDIPSSIAPVPHNTTDMPVPQPPLRDEHFVADALSTDSETDASVAYLQHRVGGERCPYYPNQEDMNDLVRELSLTKSNAELLISRLKQWDLLDEEDEVKRLINSINFPEMLSEVERRAWTSFVSVVNGFLGNHKAENYRELVDELVDAYWKMGCRMSLKLHVLHAHLDEFKDNMGDYSEEQGERFHQDIRYFEERYQGQYNENMMGDYIWNLLRESELTYRRQSRKNVSL